MQYWTFAVVGDNMMVEKYVTCPDDGPQFLALDY